MSAMEKGVKLPTFQPRRELGRTGFRATAIGIGDLADRSLPLGQCARTVGMALEAGLNLIDTAPCYEDGYSEQIVGAALKARRGSARESVFVIDKIDHLDQPVQPQVDASLGRLGIDFADLFVFHSVSTPAAWRALAAARRGMEQLGRCVQAGKARFRGISSHHPAVLLEAIASGLCDVVMFAVGPFCDRRYEQAVLPAARRAGVGTVCFKTFGAGKLLGDTSGYGRPLEQRPRGKFSSGGSAGGEPTLPHLVVGECVRYTLTLDPDVALLGMSFPNELAEALRAAAEFRPFSPEELADVRRRAAEAMAGKGPAWWDPQGPTEANP